MSEAGTATVIPITGTKPYDVIVGHDLVGRLPDLLGVARTIVVVHPASLPELAAPVIDAIAEADRAVIAVTVPDGEAAKTSAVVDELWSDVGRAGVTRSDAIVAVGGGATTDVAGFVAATWLRGVRVVHVPTTLLGMVDAAIGGKTGINTGAGKNLVGAFHPPAGVLVDLDLLATLPGAEWVNGMAEVVKAGFIADPRILDLIAADPVAAARPDGAHSRELIERSIAVKARVVSEDLEEAGLREILNYGHTLGHAIERVENYHVPHGHAVSIGMVFAAALGRVTGHLDPATADRHRAALDSVGLPTTYQHRPFRHLHDAMRMDKKARGATLRFVVLDGLAKPAILEAPTTAALEAAYAEVSR